MKDTFAITVSEVLKKAIDNFDCKIKTNPDHIIIEFTLLPYLWMEQHLTIKVYELNNSLYFETVKCSILYFPYICEIWNTLNSSQIKQIILIQWNNTYKNNQEINHYY